jgi:hypothetical protein
METVAPHAAVTSERRLNPDLQEQLPKPCTYHFPLLHLVCNSVYLPFFLGLE